MVEKKTHIHKLRRLKYKSGSSIFFCALPDCNFKTNVNLALGKRSICWRCEESFIMNEYSIRLAKPHCDKCHKPKGEIKHVHEPNTPIPATISVQEEALKDDVEGLSLLDRLNKTLEQAKTTTIEDDGEI